MALFWIESAFAILLIVGFSRSGFSSEDYGSKCTVCLREYHVVEKKFCGFTYSKTETLDFAGYDVEKMTGAQCQHIYRKTGFGRENYYPFGGRLISDGHSAEDRIFRDRWECLKTSYQLYESIPDRKLLNQTIAYVDSIVPPTATVDIYRDPRYENLGQLFLFLTNLKTVKTPDQWETILEDAKVGKDLSGATK